MSTAQANYERLRLAVAAARVARRRVIAAARGQGHGACPTRSPTSRRRSADVLAVAWPQGRSRAPRADRDHRRHHSGWAAVKPIVGGDAVSPTTTDAAARSHAPRPSSGPLGAATPRGAAGRRDPPRSGGPAIRAAASSPCSSSARSSLLAVVARVGMLQTRRSARPGRRGREAAPAPTSRSPRRAARSSTATASSSPCPSRRRRCGPIPAPSSTRPARPTALAALTSGPRRQPPTCRPRLESDKEFVYVDRQIDDATAKKVADLEAEGRLPVRRAEALLPGRRPRPGRARQHRHRRQGHRRARGAVRTAR